MLYEYQCKKCEAVVEEYRSIDDRNEDGKCPKCKGITERIASKFGFKIIGFSSLNGYSHANK